MKCDPSNLVGKSDQLSENNFTTEADNPPKPNQSAQTGAMPSAISGLPKRGDSTSEHRFTQPLSQLGEAQDLKKQARDCYVANRHYHGTTTKAKEEIRKHGFDSSRKFGGATASMVANKGWGDGQDNPRVATSKKHNYLSAAKSARVFAVLASMAPDNPGAPTLVRTLGAQAVASLELDPDSAGTANVFWRTTEKIPAANILNSQKRGEPTEESTRIFRALLDKVDVKVSEEMAGALLNEVQSDSEDDLPREVVEHYQAYWRDVAAQKAK